MMKSRIVLPNLPDDGNGCGEDWAARDAEAAVDRWGGRHDSECPIFLLEDAIAAALREAKERGKDEAWAEAAELTEVALTGIETSIRSRSKQGEG